MELSLRKALEYNPDNLVAKHQLGVVVSRLGNYDEAIRIFDDIINYELSRPIAPSDTLLYAFKTKVINRLFRTCRRTNRGLLHQKDLEEFLPFFDQVRRKSLSCMAL